MHGAAHGTAPRSGAGEDRPRRHRSAANGASSRRIAEYLAANRPPSDRARRTRCGSDRSLRANPGGGVGAADGRRMRAQREMEAQAGDEPDIFETMLSLIPIYRNGVGSQSMGITKMT